MRKLLLVLCSSLLALPTFADAVDEVRQAERSFARAFAERKADAFFAMVADDATFMGPAGTTPGKKAVFDRWSNFFKSPEAPFSWGPERVVVNAAGTIGLSTGPVFDPKGNHVGNFCSIWTKQADGSWKVLFDGPGSQSAVFADDAIRVEEGFVTTEDGTKLHYRKAGSSPVTLIVPLETYVFDDFKQLADLVTVISYDPRGRGKSSKPAKVESATIQQDVKDLEAVRAHFKVEKFIPAGYSYTGLMAAMYTLDHPEHVSRLIMLGPAAMSASTKYPASLQHGLEDVAASPDDYKKWLADREAGAAAKSPKEFCDTQWKVFRYLFVADPAHADRIRVACDLENEWPVNFEKQYEFTRKSMNELTLTPADFAKITVPVLVIHGTYDRNSPYGAGREWAMTLPNARLVTVEKAAHQSWADDPVTVFGSIRAFVRRDQPLGAEKVTKLDR